MLLVFGLTAVAAIALSVAGEILDLPDRWAMVCAIAALVLYATGLFGFVVARLGARLNHG